MPGSGSVAEPAFNTVAPGSGEIRMPPVSVCHQVSTTGQRPSPTTRWYHSQASGIDRLADGAEQAQALARRRLHRRVALAHQRADRGRRGVEDRDLVLVDDAPEARGVGVIRHALEHQAGRAVRQRAIDDITVPGDPADVGRAPVDVVLAVVEDAGEGVVHVHQVAAARVQHALRLAGRSGRVEDEERILGVHPLRLAGRQAPRP